MSIEMRTVCAARSAAVPADGSDADLPRSDVAPSDGAQPDPALSDVALSEGILPELSRWELTAERRAGQPSLRSVPVAGRRMVSPFGQGPGRLRRPESSRPSNRLSR
jgi:hypothetical protein